MRFLAISNLSITEPGGLYYDSRSQFYLLFIRSKASQYTSVFAGKTINNSWDISGIMAFSKITELPVISDIPIPSFSDLFVFRFKIKYTT